MKGYFDPYSDDDDDERPTHVECKRCGKGGLHWEELDTWQLYDAKGRKHVCSNDSVLNDFDEVQP